MALSISEFAHSLSSAGGAALTLGILLLACAQGDISATDGPRPAKPAVAYGDTSKAAADYVMPMRNAKNKIVTLETSFGNMTIELFHDLAPNHADSFYARVLDGFYSKQIFHRIIPGFMMQGGDPKGTGQGGANYTLKAEFSKEPHVAGTLSMARTNDPNSASTQFFVCFNDAPHLNEQYTVFGHLLKGYDVLYKIEKYAGSPNIKTDPPKLIKSFVSDASGKPKKG